LTSLEDSLTNAGLDGLVQLETLAKRLSQGALPLAYALRCATDIASSLRDLHEEGRLHGSVNALTVVVTNTGARLLPPHDRALYTVAGADVAAFGALLYRMVTGAQPSTHTTPPFPAVASRSTPKGLRIAATHLASKCLRSTSNSFTEMQKVLTEVRLLGLQSEIRQNPAAFQPLRAPAVSERRAVAPTAPRQPAAGRQERGAASRLFTPVPAEGFMAVKDVDTAEPPASEINCPACGVRYVHPSRPSSWFEALLGAWRVPTLRCHRCLYRYIVIFGRFKFFKAANRSSSA
jgi:hypothetical protein